MSLRPVRLTGAGGAKFGRSDLSSMTGAMYAAISGLKSHMNKLNVIGNNVANVNTAGYKSQRAVFEDAMYTMYKNGSNGSVDMAGNNPSQIGYGSNIAGIDLNMTQPGSFTPGMPWDQMIVGDGFFLVGDKTVADTIDPNNPESFKALELTRVGQLRISPDGYVTDINGKCVYGFATVGMDAKGNPIVSDQLVPMRIPRVEKCWHDAKTDQIVEKPTDDQIKKGEVVQKDTVRYPVVASENDKPVMGDALLKPDLVGKQGKLDDYKLAKENDTDPDPEPLPYAQLDSLGIDPKTGRISGTVKSTGEIITIGFMAIGNVTNPNGVTHTEGFYYKAGDGAGDLNVTVMGGVQKELQTVGGGKLDYVNGSLAKDPTDMTKPLTDLSKLSDRARVNSAGKTYLQGGGYEGANTDLATEISEMITTQRGYQANTRIITVTDSMLEELVNMKR